MKLNAELLFFGICKSSLAVDEEVFGFKKVETEIPYGL